MITQLFPNRLLDIYGSDEFFEKYLLIENDTIILEVPGFSKKDLSLEFDQKEYRISIKGTKEINKRKRSINQSVTDRRLKDLDPEKIEANVEDGILYIHLPEFDKKPKETKRQILLK